MGKINRPVDYNNKYEVARNKLINKAVGLTNKAVPKDYETRDSYTYYSWCDRWNFYFHSLMNQLSKEAGLC